MNAIPWEVLCKRHKGAGTHHAQSTSEKPSSTSGQQGQCQKARTLYLADRQGVKKYGATSS
eukprot:1034914-Pelagomonas_calceolata.AAC.1